MKYFEWTSDLDVGVHEMNCKHQHLIDLMNDFVAKADARDPEGVKSSLEKLQGYTVQHFKDEEAYMQSIGFTGLASHQRIHQRLLESLAEHAGPIFAGSMEVNGLETFLKMWLKSHIMGIDSKYGDHAKSKVV